MDKCPNCKARIKSTKECYRCGFDFAFTLQCESTAKKFHRQALAYLKHGDLDLALELSSLSEFYYRSPQIEKLKNFILLKQLYHV